jgi:serine protease
VQFLNKAQLDAAGLPTTFTQTGSVTDTTPPQLQSFSLSQSSVDTSSSSQTITLTAHITDDLSGLAGNSGPPSGVSFVSPSGHQSVSAMFNTSNRSSGTAQDGIYQTTMTVPQYAEPGTWTVQNFILGDQVGNVQFLDKAQLDAAGMPTSFDNA